MKRAECHNITCPVHKKFKELIQQQGGLYDGDTDGGFELSDRKETVCKD